MENDVNRVNDDAIETEGTNTVFDDDSLDVAVAAADDTGMISQQQFAIRSDEAEILP